MPDTQIGEFQRGILALVHPLVQSPECVKVLPDSADEAALAADPSCTSAFVKITSLKPRIEVFGEGEGARAFLFSTPFTSSGKVRGVRMAILLSHNTCRDQADAGVCFSSSAAATLDRSMKEP